MITPLRIRRVQIFPLAIPMRMRFEHAAAARNVADPIVVQLTAEAPYADVVGYGETLARRYVTGETAETAVDDIREMFLPHLLEFRASSFSEAVEFAHGLPMLIEGRLVNAARCAVELALIDLAGRAFGRRAADVTGWLDQIGFEAPGCVHKARYSGMVVGRTPRKLAWLLRAQRCYGLRDFKIKVATEGWAKRLELASRLLGRAIRRGDATLRADANGAWDFDRAADALPLLEQFGVCALEQPLPTSDDARLPELAERTSCDLIADESLLTVEDAGDLIDAGVRVFNIRLAKNGGLLPSLAIAQRVLEADRDVQLGCLVGETSILSAAGLAFLECCPSVRFVEGAFGGLLLSDELTRKPIRFGRGGKLQPREGFGLGVDVLESGLRRLVGGDVVTMNL